MGGGGCYARRKFLDMPNFVDHKPCYMLVHHSRSGCIHNYCAHHRFYNTRSMVTRDLWQRKPPCSIIEASFNLVVLM